MEHEKFLGLFKECLVINLNVIDDHRFWREIESINIMDLSQVLEYV